MKRNRLYYSHPSLFPFLPRQNYRMGNSSHAKQVKTLKQFFYSLPDPLPEDSLNVIVQAQFSTINASIPRDLWSFYLEKVTERVKEGNTIKILRSLYASIEAKLEEETKSGRLEMIQPQKLQVYFSVIDGFEAQVRQCIWRYIQLYPTVTEFVQEHDLVLFYQKKYLIKLGEMKFKVVERLHQTILLAYDHLKREILPSITVFLEFDMNFQAEKDRISASIDRNIANLVQMESLPGYLWQEIRKDIDSYYNMLLISVFERRFLPVIAYEMRKNLLDLKNRRKVLFEQTENRVKLAIFSKIWSFREILGRRNEGDVVSDFGRVLGLEERDVLPREVMEEYAKGFRELGNDYEKWFVSVCVLVTMMKLDRGWVYGVRYTATRRSIFREVISLFLTSVPSSFLCNCAEQQLVSVYSPDLGAHLPDPQIPSPIASCCFEPISEGPYLSSILVISGLFSQLDDMHEAWKGIGTSSSIYGLRWQAGFLPLSISKSLSNATSSMLGTLVAMIDYSVAAAPSLLVGGTAAIASLGLSATLALGLTFISEFAMYCLQASRTGRQLAAHLQSQVFGQLPVTLIGFSLGCRVIYYCLKELYNSSSEKCHIQDVILLGGAAENKPTTWKRLQKCVSGRIVNVYSCNDSILRYFYQTAMVGRLPPIGLGPVHCVGMENYDASSYVGSHKDHRKYLASTLVRIGFQY